MRNGDAIVAVALAVAMLIVGLAVADYVRSADAIAITDGKNSLWATIGKAGSR